MLSMLPALDAAPRALVSASAPPAAGTDDPRLRVLRHRPDLAAEAPAFRAALVLLTGPAVLFNIDLLSRRTGIPRPFVAACVRRLVDNGVWAGGAADYPWSGPEDPRFWNDAAVAEGRLCRRRADDGAVEWASAGAWRKPYEYAADPGPGLAVAYRPAEAPEEEPAPAPRAPAAAEPEPEDEPLPAPIRARAQTPVLPPAGAFLATAPVCAGSGADLFPGTQWLS